MRNTTWIYLLVTVLSLLGIWQLIEMGRALEHLPAQQNGSDAAFSLSEHLSSHLHHPIARLLLQILSIMFVARTVGWLMSRLGQPSVIGEILAGIMLGPSLLGWLLPEFSAYLFPPASLPALQSLSQVGLVLFMFIVGMELDINVVKKSGSSSLLISHAGIFLPYLLGVYAAYVLYERFAPPGVAFASFALFMGIAMSITAFPVLARIIQERGLNKKPIGTLVLTSAAIDDVTAWCLLVLVITFVNATSVWGFVVTAVLTASFLFVGFGILRPLLQRLASRFYVRETVNRNVFSFLMAIVLMGAFSTEVIGIHPLIGAFTAGVIIPQNPAFRHVLQNKIEDVSLVLLLPLFFVFTGLRTNIGVLLNPELWQTSLLIIGLAVSGKFIGTGLAAKISGQSWKDSLYVGALMNTRGLMELIVLNIGYDLGVLSTELFSIMVVMALFTTFMTGPSLRFIDWIFSFAEKKAERIKANTFRILLSFGPPQMGPRLLKLANQLTRIGDKPTELTAMHLSPSADISIKEAEAFERDGFSPILSLSRELGKTIKTYYKPSNHVIADIIKKANSPDDDFSLMLAGASRSLFSDEVVSGKVREFYEVVKCPVGVLVDKGYGELSRIGILKKNAADNFLNKYAQPLASSGSQILAVDSESSAETLLGCDLVLVSLSYWDDLQERTPSWLRRLPSLLIINR